MKTKQQRSLLADSVSLSHITISVIRCIKKTSIRKPGLLSRDKISEHVYRMLHEGDLFLRKVCEVEANMSRPSEAYDIWVTFRSFECCIRCWAGYFAKSWHRWLTAKVSV